jgi:stearoyl-CoA desaturase (delta-9 desaturase)
VRPYRIDWVNMTVIGSIHLLALLAFVPLFFNWAAVIVAIISARLFGLLGINIGYHRLLTHRGFACPKWLEHTLVVIAICCVEDTPRAGWRCIAVITKRRTKGRIRIARSPVFCGPI